MKNAQRPTLPGPIVIVNDNLPTRRSVGLGVEEGPLTDAEKRKYMPPPLSAKVRAAGMAEKRRLAAKADEGFGRHLAFPPKPFSGFRPARKPKYSGQILNEKYRTRIERAKEIGEYRLLADGTVYLRGESGALTRVNDEAAIASVQAGKKPKKRAA